jgi:hypothetical protein
MIGGIAGILLVISYLATAWSGPGDGDTLFNGGFLPGLLVILIIGAVGVFLFPRTVGMMFTPITFATPIAFVLALINSGIQFAFVMAGFGIAAWAVTFIVGKVRPESTN